MGLSGCAMRPYAMAAMDNVAVALLLASTTCFKRQVPCTRISQLGLMTMATWSEHELSKTALHLGTAGSRWRRP